MHHLGRQIIALVTCAIVAGAQQAPRAAEAADPFATRVGPFLKRYCFDCHAGDEPEGKVRLDHTQGDAALENSRPLSEKVTVMLRSRRMPPKDHPRPPAAEIAAVVAWFEAQLSGVDCDAPRDPGHVPLRRLNRAEYANTVRDLLGIPVPDQVDFPPDDVGYGFDNIGDVLTLPPVLMEKYLAAAEIIAGRALDEGRPAGKPLVRWQGGDLRNTQGGRRSGEAWLLTSNGEMYADIQLPASGKYLVTIAAEGDQAGDEPVRMALAVDGQQRHVFDVKLHGKLETFEHEIQIDAGRHRIAVAFINDYYRPEATDPDQRDRNLLVESVEIAGPLGTRADSEVARQLFFAQPGKDGTPGAAAATIMKRLVTRAYRRPASDAEVQRLAKLVERSYQQDKDFEKGIALALQALLVSPKFLYRIELDAQPDDPAPVRMLDEYELASRMSYFLWSTMPDDQLAGQAGNGTLRKNLPAQIKRMLGDPRSRALADNFATQWLGIRAVDAMQPDPDKFSEYDAQLRDAMRNESILFFDAVIREDRSILDLVDADFTILNERLARHYGIPDVQGDQFRRVDVADSPRGGVLTQGSVLTVTSNPTRTSPVKRGKWILENILGTPPPPPPPDVPQLPETGQAATAASLRKRLEIHRQDASCAVCHTDMDALGLALENFDAVGAWRSKDGPFDIDASAQLPSGENFVGPSELKRLLQTQRRDQFVHCLVSKLLTYALGRGLEYYDRCTVDEICAELQQNDFRFSTLVTAIITSDPFQKRRARR